MIEWAQLFFTDSRVFAITISLLVFFTLVLAISYTIWRNQ